MKRILLSLCCLITCLSAIFAKDYVIEGSLPGEDGREFTVFDYDSRSVIGKGKVVDGKLIIKGTTEQPLLVRVESDNIFTNCVLDSLAVVDFETHYPSDGSLLNRLYRDNKREESLIVRDYDNMKNKCNNGEISKDSLEKYRWRIVDETVDLYVKSIKDNNNGVGYSSLLSLSGYSTFTPDDWEKLYDTMDGFLKDTRLVADLNERYGNQRKTMVGKPFVDIEGIDVEGNKSLLSDYVGKGKYVLVDFWASWCGPCKAESETTLKPLYERMKDKDNFEILGVATWDNLDRTRKALETLGYKWPQILDAGMTPMKLYGFDGIPMIILFGPDGTILERNLRGEYLIERVEQYVGK